LISDNQKILPGIDPSTSMEHLENLVAHEKKQLIRLQINKFDSHFFIDLPIDKVNLSSIRKRIKLHYSKTATDQKLNWKYVWSTYCLVFKDRYLLVSNMNLDLKQIGIKD
jgi:hypothetical protein